VEGFRKAREAAERALQLEPNLAEGHAALGLIRMTNDWDWKGADASFRRALELAPGSAPILRLTAVLAGDLGRLDEAVELLRRAVALDPLSAQGYRSLAAWCIRADLLDEAQAAARMALELNPQGGLTRCWLGLIELAQGRLEEALLTMRSERHETFRLLGVALDQHARGRAAESEAALQELIEKNAAGGAYQIAEGYAFRGEANPAFEWLERAYAQRDPGLSTVKVSPLLKNLHSDPRWQPFLEKMGLAD
jgi:tetratricopeptide (TPR) repeat protein